MHALMNSVPAELLHLLTLQRYSLAWPVSGLSSAGASGTAHMALIRNNLRL